MKSTTASRPDVPAISARERTQIDRANAAGCQPILFVHGLWLLPSSWDRWSGLFEATGYVALSPDWPDDPDSVEEAHDHPETFARKSVAQVARHLTAVIAELGRKPVLVGHSFGGAIAQILAGEGQAAATVAIDPAGFRGVLPLPFSALKSAWPVLGNPLNRHRAVPLTFEQFRYSFANAVDEGEARELFESYAVAGSGEPLFQAAAANLNPWTELRVDTHNPARGPLLIISGEKDNVVPRSVAHAAFELQKANQNPTEFIEMPGRGHALTIDSGWREVAQAALDFIGRFVPARDS
ncbi:MAG TPA: alpha/beta hydrolase [Croceibacterium sp.]|nr:alpha/beta hydrolase [Croceibacterium sp.]